MWFDQRYVLQLKWQSNKHNSFFLNKGYFLKNGNWYWIYRGENLPINCLIKTFPRKPALFETLQWEKIMLFIFESIVSFVGLSYRQHLEMISIFTILARESEIKHKRTCGFIWVSRSNTRVLYMTLQWH